MEEREELVDCEVSAVGPDYVKSCLERGFTMEEDVERVRSYCSNINNSRSEQIVRAFFSSVLKFSLERESCLRERDNKLKDNWYFEPWYYVYAQYFGGSTFSDLLKMLDYLEWIGIKNLYILPHYTSEMADGGYDVTEFTVRKALGGYTQYKMFMDEATRRGFRVATDAIFNHVSTSHEWFKRAEKGEEKYLKYFLERNGREKINEYTVGGDIICEYRDPDGTISRRICIFPDVDRTHELVVKVEGNSSYGERVQFYREFYPFQVDLDLQNPDVLEEIFEILGKELNDGILGKRTDAIAHWIKKPGTMSDGLPEVHSIQGLLKSFGRHICSKFILIPEAVRSAEVLGTYAGDSCKICKTQTSTEGDALLSFEMQAAMREMTYFQRTAPFWTRVYQFPSVPQTVAWLNLLEHHDETYLGYYEGEVRFWMSKYIDTRGGVTYKNGMSAGCRYANCLDKDPSRIATAIFCSFVIPGVPMMYYGCEIGWCNDYDHAERIMHGQFVLFKEKRIDSLSDVGQCYDPRELQRGIIPREHFLRAKESGYLPLITLKRLIQLRALHPSLSDGTISPIDCGHAGVLCMVREYEDDVKEDAVMCVANLTPFTTEIAMDCGILRGMESCEDIISGEQWRLDWTSLEGKMQVELPPFSRFIFDLRANK